MVGCLDFMPLLLWRQAMTSDAAKVRSAVQGRCGCLLACRRPRARWPASALFVQSLVTWCERSDSLKLNTDQTKIKRVKPFKQQEQKSIDERSIVVKNIVDTDSWALLSLFAALPH